MAPVRGSLPVTELLVFRDLDRLGAAWMRAFAAALVTPSGVHNHGS